MKKLAFISIKNRLLMIYLPLIILPNIFIIIVAYQLFSYETDRVSHKHAEQTVEVVNRHLETYLDELERLSLFPYFHSGVMDILRNKEQFPDPNESYKEYKLFEDMFNNIMLNPREDMFNVTLYRNDGQRYFNTRIYTSLNVDYDWKNTDWYRKTVEANGGVVYLANSGEDGRFSVLHHNIFSISRLVKSDNGENLGVILIDANFQGITDILKAVGLGESSNVVLRDSTNRIIFSQNELYLEELDKAHPNNKLTVDGQTLFIENYDSTKTGWKVSVIIPGDEISNAFVTIREIILVMLVFFGLIIVAVTFWFSEKLTRPIRELHQKMKMVEKGDYDVSIEITRRDEIGSLGKAFNKMSFQIKELIHRVYEFNLRQKEAELNNLKTQIRPHFLYNTLEAIRSLAEINDNHEVVEMTTSLGSILRYSVKTHEKLVSLEQEIDYIQQYINIQNIMLGDAIKVEYDIDPAILSYRSIPLLLQPVVENAFQHGLYGKRQDGHLHIQGKRARGEVVFTITDNGKGIPRDSLDRMNRYLQSNGKEEGLQLGIGMTNVNQRLKIVFGEAYGLFLGQNPAGGTVVTIKFPIVDTKQQTG